MLCTPSSTLPPLPSSLVRRLTSAIGDRAQGGGDGRAAGAGGTTGGSGGGGTELQSLHHLLQGPV